MASPDEVACQKPRSSRVANPARYSACIVSTLQTRAPFTSTADQTPGTASHWPGSLQLVPGKWGWSMCTHYRATVVRADGDGAATAIANKPTHSYH